MKRFMFAFLFVVFACFSLSTVAIAQPGEEAVVPSAMYPTIRAALNAGAQVIRLEPGVYAENLYIGGTRMIYAEETGTAVIVGDNIANTITISPGALVTLHGLRILNGQTGGGYTRAAIFTEYAAGLTLSDCQVYFTTIGLSANHTVFTEVSGSEFFGPQNGTALFLANQGSLLTGGAWLMNNRFFNVGVAIDASESIHRFWMSGSGDGDSNFYYFVRSWLVPQRALID